MSIPRTPMFSADEPDDDQTRADQLRARASQVADGVSAAEANLERWRHARVSVMKQMNQAGFPWSEIGRRFGISPQAAMYACGVAKRTKAKKTPPQG